MGGIVDFTKKQNLSGATFTGLGACSSVQLSYYDLEKKEYIKKDFNEDLEIINLTGNISLLGEEPAVHMHGTFGRTDYSTIGGHVFRMVVFGTCEIHLQKLDKKIEREKDEETGLNLLASKIA